MLNKNSIVGARTKRKGLKVLHWSVRSNMKHKALKYTIIYACCLAMLKVTYHDDVQRITLLEMFVAALSQMVKNIS